MLIAREACIAAPGLPATAAKLVTPLTVAPVAVTTAGQALMTPTAGDEVAAARSWADTVRVVVATAFTVVDKVGAVAVHEAVTERGDESSESDGLLELVYGRCTDGGNAAKSRSNSHVALRCKVLSRIAGLVAISNDRVRNAAADANAASTVVVIEAGLVTPTVLNNAAAAAAAAAAVALTFGGGVLAMFSSIAAAVPGAPPDSIRSRTTAAKDEEVAFEPKFDALQQP